MKIDRMVLKRVEAAMSDASQWIAIGEEGEAPAESWFQYNRHFDSALKDLRRLLENRRPSLKTDEERPDWIALSRHIEIVNEAAAHAASMVQVRDKRIKELLEKYERALEDRIIERKDAEAECRDCRGPGLIVCVKCFQCPEHCPCSTPATPRSAWSNK